MKIFSFIRKAIFVSPVVLGIVISSCSKKDNNTHIEPAPVVADYGKLEVRFFNEIDGQPINFGIMAYTNAMGNQYKVDLLRYYITNFTLINDNGVEKNFKNYHLVDAADTNTCKFTLDSVTNAKYSSVKFYLGVDTGRNHDGTQFGDLDPVTGMVWTWNTGYIFFKHEGAFKNSSLSNQDLLFHYGTDKALVTITLPVSSFTVKGDIHKLYLNFDLNKLYAEPNQIDFNVYNYQQSSTLGDALWIAKLKSNFPNAFTIDKVQ